MLRDNFHVVLGERVFSNEQEISLGRLYEVNTLEAIIDRFQGLLERDPEEQEVQTFLEETPLLFHRFSPARILKRPPLLNQFQADFAVVSRSGELVLVEIEKPGKRLLKKSGGRTAELIHAFDQVMDWLHLIDDHRITCLQMMGLKNDDITAIRGVVIIGRDKPYKREHLRKLKSSDSGSITLLTYDDLLAGLEALIKEMRGL